MRDLKQLSSQIKIIEKKNRIIVNNKFEILLSYLIHCQKKSFLKERQKKVHTFDFQDKIPFEANESSV